MCSYNLRALSGYGFKASSSDASVERKYVTRLSHREAMIFVDSGAWIARELEDDRLHEDALARFQRARTGEFGAFLTSILR